MVMTVEPFASAMEKWSLAIQLKSSLSRAVSKSIFLLVPQAQVIANVSALPLPTWPWSSSLSSLTMVPTAIVSAIVAPLALERLTVKVSLPSASPSPLMSTWTSLEVSPAAKVTVPLDAT